jgi:hypothetical protein
MPSDLRGAADALKEAENAWKGVTTLQPQGRAFGAASFELFDTLRKVLAAPAEPEKQRALGLDVNNAMHSIERGTRDLANFVEQSHDATRACLNSGLLFAPARGRDQSVKHLHARNRGEYLPVPISDAHAVIDPIERGAAMVAQTPRLTVAPEARWPLPTMR